MGGLHWIFVAVHRLSLVEVNRAALPCVAQATHCSGFSCGAQALGTGASVVVARGSEVVEHWFICSKTCGIFLSQGLNPCPLHWGADSYPLYYQGSPFPNFSCFVSNCFSKCTFFFIYFY